jgi:hypothetical protein
MTKRSKSSSARILSVSQHKNVLDTKNAVLRSAGYEVVTTMDLSEAERIAANDTRPWTAAVLGDSIPYALRRDLGRKLKGNIPGLAVVELLRSSDPAPDRKACDAWLNALDGPEILLETLHSLRKPK